MEPDNLTIRLLQEIRDEVRRSSDRADARFAKMDERLAKMDERFARMGERFERNDQRLEVIETTLRDLAEQMVLLARGVKSALEHRGSVEARLDAAERRLDALEKTVGH
jgi:chromosome segregation ATPase